jgi:branched-chain amino acid transport system substrate-binding protein
MLDRVSRGGLDRRPRWRLTAPMLMDSVFKGYVTPVARAPGGIAGVSARGGGRYVSFARTVLLAALVCAAIAVWPSGAAAASGVAASAKARTEKITIGALLDLSAGWTTLGRTSRVTLQLAREDANERLRRLGSRFRVQLALADAAGDPDVALRKLRGLARLGARVVIGPESSSEVAALRSEAQRLGVLLVSQGSTAHTLAIGGDNVFRLVPDDVREAEALDALLERDGITAVVPIWRMDPGNEGLATSLRAEVQARGGSVSGGVPYTTEHPDFEAAAAALRSQVDALETTVGEDHVAVYLAGFDEVVDLFHVVQADPVLAAVRWYGSDGVALSQALVTDTGAATFAAEVGYPNPVLGLDDTASPRAQDVIERAAQRLGTAPDAFSLAAYDGLRIGVSAARASLHRGVAFLRRAFALRADGYRGVSGRIALNDAGDRAFGSYDFWSVCLATDGPVWTRTASYLSTRLGVGTIVDREACPT